MNDATQIQELRELHRRQDQLVTAVDTLTSAVSEHILQIRAYENIINRSWWLTRWLPQREVQAEMHRVNEVESKLRGSELRLRQRAIRMVEEQVKAKVDEEAREKLDDKREKKYLRDLRRHRGASK